MAENQVVCREKYGSAGKEVNYVKQEGRDTLTVLMYANKTLTNLSHFFTAVFLPQGYPESVSDDYLMYQLWDTIQAFASSITGTLATQAVLKGMGVGDESATPMAATITWILKDGTGMVGRILFAWFQGSNLDCNCKQWRLFGDILNDFAICLELLAPIFTGTFTLVVCIAGLCKSLVGVAGGATRAALMQHQAKRDNLADISAKDGSQETLVNLAALICSLVLIPTLAGKELLTWMFFVVFTILHLLANYMAVKSVVSDSFNQSRLFVLTQYYAKTGGDILSIAKVNSEEPLLIVKQFPLKINLGCSFSKITHSFSEMKRLCTMKNSKYLLNLNVHKKEINIVFHRTIENEDVLQACWEAMIICICYDNIFKGMKFPFLELDNIIAEFERGSQDIEAILKLSSDFVTTEFPFFLSKIQTQKWNVKRSQLGSDEWKLEWDISGLSVAVS